MGWVSRRECWQGAPSAPNIIRDGNTMIVKLTPDEEAWAARALMVDLGEMGRIGVGVGRAGGRAGEKLDGGG